MKLSVQKQEATCTCTQGHEERERERKMMTVSVSCGLIFSGMIHMLVNMNQQDNMLEADTPHLTFSIIQTSLEVRRMSIFTH
jgi:hypothetical protein